MKNKIEIPTEKAYRLINYGPVVLVSSAQGTKKNIAAIAWASPLSSTPPLVGVAVYQGHFTSQLISESKEFVVNIPPAELRGKVVECGSVHGKDLDKFERFKLTPLAGNKVKAPLVQECYAHLECKLTDKVEVGDHFLFVGKIVAARVDQEVLDSKGIIDPKNVKTLHHLGSDKFGKLTEV